MSYVLNLSPYREHPHIGFLKLNRPEVLNALSTDLLNNLVTELMKLEDDPNIRVIILTGNEKAFAAGADLKQMSTATAMEQTFDRRFRIWKQVSLITKPIIAAVHGFCLGGGNELAMLCDLILAGESARFGQPEVNVGTVPGAGGTQRLPRVIGKSKAMMMAFTGEMIDARTACDWGLVAKVFPDQTLLNEAYQMAKKIAAKSPVSVKLIKESINKSYELPLNSGVDYERRQFYLTFASEDLREGTSAFLEKRKPEYKGQ